MKVKGAHAGILEYLVKKKGEWRGWKGEEIIEAEDAMISAVGWQYSHSTMISSCMDGSTPIPP